MSVGMPRNRASTGCHLNLRSTTTRWFPPIRTALPLAAAQVGQLQRVALKARAATSAEDRDGRPDRGGLAGRIASPPGILYHLPRTAPLSKDALKPGV